MSWNKAHLTIADVVFSYTYEREVSIEEECDSIYKPFMGGKQTQKGFFHSDVSIAYKQERTIFKDTEGWSLLFRCDPSWALFKKDADFRFVLHSENIGQPNMTATCRYNFQQINIDCGPKYLTRERPPAILSNPLSYPLDQLLIIHILASEGGIIIHTAGVEYQGRAYLFAGISGSGKSTIAGMFGSDPEIEAINDDRIIVRKKEGIGYLAYGTPWPGEKRISRNICLPLGGIFFIAKSHENRIRKLRAGEALQKIFPVTSVPWYHKEMAGRVMDFCGELMQHIPMYEFSFRLDGSAADYLLNHINNGAAFR